MNRTKRAHMYRRLPTLAFAGVLIAWFAAPISQAEQQPLNGEELTTLITGNALQGSLGAKILIMYFDPSGKVVATLRNSPDSGQWWVKGNDYCHKFVRLFDGMERCYAWHPPASADGRYLLESTSSFKGRDIRGKITKGRPDGY